MTSIAQRRLRTQHLTGPGLATPLEIVRWLGAVQAQDFHAACWGVAQRMRTPSLAAVTAAFARGDLVRTHVMRPTWHFVAVEDLGWLQALTGPRVQKLSAYYYAQHGLDAKALRKSDAALVRALAGGPLVRGALAAAVGATVGTGFSMQLMHAELGCLICSGPRRGKQHTYRLAPPTAPPLPRDEALARLATRYLAGHGPAQAEDLAWWSGLTVADARCGLALAGHAVASEVVDGRTYYRSASAPRVVRHRGPTVQLLPNYDELVIAYKDRRDFYDPARLDGQRPPGVLDRHLVAFDGMLVGGWRVTRAGVDTKLLVTPTAAERRALAAAIARYRRVTAS